MDARRSLHLRMVAVCALGAAALWALIAFFVDEERRLTVQRAETAGRNLARALAAHQETSVRAVDLALSRLREHWSREAPDFDQAVARHEEQLGKDRVLEVVVLDRDDQPRYSRPPLDRPVSFSEREYVQALKRRGADELHVSEPVTAPLSGKRAIQFMRPIFDADKAYAGAIALAVPPPALEVALEGIELGPQGIIMLARADGTVLARTRGLDPARVVILVGWAGLGEDAPPAGTFTGRSRFDGVERFFAYHRLQNYPLTVYVGQDAEAVLQPYHRERALLLGGGALATLLLIAIAVLLAGRARDRVRLAGTRP
jgi:hypothetical protein